MNFPNDNKQQHPDWVESTPNIQSMIMQAVQYVFEQHASVVPSRHDMNHGMLGSEHTAKRFRVEHSSPTCGPFTTNTHPQASGTVLGLRQHNSLPPMNSSRALFTTNTHPQASGTELGLGQHKNTPPMNGSGDTNQESLTGEWFNQRDNPYISTNGFNTISYQPSPSIVTPQKETMDLSSIFEKPFDLIPHKRRPRKAPKKSPVEVMNVDEDDSDNSIPGSSILKSNQKLQPLKKTASINEWLDELPSRSFAANFHCDSQRDNTSASSNGFSQKQQNHFSIKSDKKGSHKTVSYQHSLSAVTPKKEVVDISSIFEKPFDFFPQKRRNTPRNCRKNAPVEVLNVDNDDSDDSLPGSFNLKTCKNVPPSKKTESINKCLDELPSPSFVVNFNDDFWSHRENLICLVVETESDTHVIESNKSGQIYFVEQLTTNPHYQLMLHDLHVLRNHHRVVFYSNLSDHLSSFLYILNSDASISPFISSFPLEDINLVLEGHNSCNSSGKDSRQGDNRRISYGYTTQAWTVDEKGFNIPNFHKGTDTPLSKLLFTSGTSLLSMTGLPAQFRYKPHPDRKPYAGRIVPGNVFEGLTMFSTNPDCLLKRHTDTNNSSYDEWTKAAVVVGVNGHVGGSRVGIVFYNKKSVEDVYGRNAELEQVCHKFLEAHQKLHEDRKKLRRNLQTSVLARDLNDKFYTLPCNIDPLGFHNLFVYTLCLATESLGLNPVEVLSFTEGMEIVPNTCFFFSVAVKRFLHLAASFSGKRAMCPDIYDTVHSLLQGIVKLRKDGKEISSNQNTEKLGIYRFFDRTQIRSSFLSPKELHRKAHLKFMCCLAMWYLHPTPPPKKEVCVAVYTSFVNLVRELSLPGNGELCAMHMSAVLSLMGLAPSWLYGYALLKGKLKDRIPDTFPSIHGIWKNERTTMESIGRYLEKATGEPWSMAKVENFICKYSRLHRNSDNHFSDVHHVDEMFIERKVDGTMEVTIANNDVVICSKGVLFEEWEFAGTLMTLEEIARQYKGFRAMKHMPTLSRMENLLPEFEKYIEDGSPTIGRAVPYYGL